MNLLSVVTVTHNSSHVLEGFLSRLTNDIRPDIRIVVVDSGSADVDASRSIAERYGALFSSSRVNFGYGTGSNLGSSLVESEWLAFVNPDVHLPISALTSLIVESRDHDIQCIGPQVLDEDGVLQDRWGAMAAPPWRRGASPNRPEPGLTIVQSISGCCMVMPRDWFERLGGFDESFFMFCEEIDLHKRLGELGGRVATSSKVYVRTAGGASSAGVTARWSQAERSVAHIQFTMKHYSQVEGLLDCAWRFIEMGYKPEFRPRATSWSQLCSGIIRFRRLGNR